MDRGAWWATVHEVPKSRIGLSYFTYSIVTEDKMLIAFHVRLETR